MVGKETQKRRRAMIIVPVNLSVTPTRLQWRLFPDSEEFGVRQHQEHDLVKVEDTAVTAAG